MAKKNQHSEEVQQLMGKMPNWIIRLGTLFIFGVFLIILCISYFIRYPQIVSAPIVLTSINPPVDLLAKSSGKIEAILVKSTDVVKQNDAIAVLSSTANYNDVRSLNNKLIEAGENWQQYFIDSLQKSSFRLGELQAVYAQFCKQLILYSSYVKMNRHQEKLDLFRKQIEKQHSSLEIQKVQYEFSDRDLEYEKRQLLRDSLMHSKGAKTLTEYEATQRSFLSKQSALLSSKLALSNSEMTLYNLQDQVLDLNKQDEEQYMQFNLSLGEIRNQLLLSIEQWQEKYVIRSPINGKVNFSVFWSVNQNVTIGQRLATVIPERAMQIIGRLSIPSSGYAKVKIGDQVNVKLNSYPFMEYGSLKGTITSLSAVPENDKDLYYVAEVSFPNGLRSNYDIQLNFIQQMDGTGEIIIKDMRLLDKFLMPLKSAFLN